MKPKSKEDTMKNTRNRKKQTLLERHEAFMQRLASTKESLRELSADEDVKLLGKIMERLRGASG